MREIYRKIAQFFCEHKWEIEFVRCVNNKVSGVYICRKCGKRRVEND